MRESRTYGSGRGACHEMHVPTATCAPPFLAHPVLLIIYLNTAKCSPHHSASLLYACGCGDLIAGFSLRCICRLLARSGRVRGCPLSGR